MSKENWNTRQFTSGLEKVVADYRHGLMLINREFDEACERFDRSIADFRDQSATHAGYVKNERSQESRLRQQADKIEDDLSKIGREIAKLTQGIAAVDAAIRATQQEKSNLEQQIQNRWFIVKIYYFFCQDEDQARKRRDKLQDDLDNRDQERAALEQTRRKFTSTRMQRESEKKRLQDALAEILQKIDRLNKSTANSNERIRALANERSEAEKRRTKRKDRLWMSVPVAWTKAVGESQQALRRIHRQQPAFADLRDDEQSVGAAMPDALLLGLQKVYFRELHCLIPHVIRFPFEQAILLPEESESQRRLAHHVLLRLMQAVPPGRLELTLIDPLKQGESVAPFKHLLNVEQIVPQQRVLTRADEIESSLGKLTDEVEELIQHRFKGRISDWTEFNTANPDNPLRYTVVLLFDVPEQISDKSLWYLERLCENGPRCGVLPVIAVNNRRMEDRRFDRLRASMRQSTQRLDALLQNNDDFDSEVTFSYQPEVWPQQETLDRFLATLAARYVESTRFNKTLSDLWIGCDPRDTTIGGFDIPIGWTSFGEAVSLRLGATDSEHHALLAGKTGTGKSNLLHVMIHSLCEKYSSQEVELYLLDYKESTEFTVYANPPLPHARLVATESDSEYGVTVLQHLVDEQERRARLFKSAGVPDFLEYRNSHSERLPRILLIIDEFQVLLAEERQVKETAEKLLSQLLKQGRSFGIHLLLATQTLRGINAQSTGALVSQLGCRIALACGSEDSAQILGANNWAAAELKSPPEGIINNDSGRESCNVKFLIPHAKNAFCRKHLSLLSDRAKKKGIADRTRIFNGAHLPHRPAFRDTVGCWTDELILGERLTFTADALAVPLTRRSSFNVLFCGYDDVIHDGLLSSTLSSLAFSDGNFDEIVYFNGRGIEPGGGFQDAARLSGTKYNAFDNIGAVPLQEIADGIGRRRTALIIDGLDSEKALHPLSTFQVRKPSEPSTPADLLKRIAEEGPREGTFVFAFLDNWRRVSASCRELLSFFELRIAFCMDEDDAGTLVSGAVGKFKGLEKPNRAIFVDRMKNETFWFRPYVTETREKT